MLGEWGHNPLPWRELHDGDEKYCGCGRYGCIETYLSGPGFSNCYNLKNNTNLNSHEIIERYQQDKKFQPSWCRFFGWSGNGHRGGYPAC